MAETTRGIKTRLRIAPLYPTTIPYRIGQGIVLFMAKMLVISR
jgi:hypothetical protein